MTEPNPYAPPAVTLDARSSEVPLPSGTRRFRLDADRYDRFQRIVLVQLMLIALPVLVVVFGLFAAVASLSPEYVALGGGLSVAWIVVARLVRIRLARRSNLESYELLVSERAVRRNLAGWVSAEVLRPEISDIIEVPTGLWIRCQQPPRSLFVASAVDDYTAARDIFATWAPIARLGGLSAWTSARRENRKQGLRDETFGTALAIDPTLASELEMLRSASSTVGRTTPPSRAAAFGRLIVIWFALIFVFLAVWQFLAPSSPR